MPHPASWALLGFQKSAHNSAGRVEFTVNATVATKAARADARELGKH
ncbi:hypothetical protein [Streptomyces sp. NPDC001843]